MVDVAAADGFGPADEVRVLTEFDRAGHAVVQGAAAELQAPPSYRLRPGPVGGGPRTAPAVTTAPLPAVELGARPTTPAVTPPVVAPAPVPPAVPALSSEAGAATAQTEVQVQAAISSLGQRAPPLPTPTAAPPVPLSGAADPARVSASATAATAGLAGQHAAAAQQVAAFQPEPELHPAQPPQVAAAGTGVVARPAEGATQEPAGPGPAIFAAPEGDTAFSAARRAWGQQFAPHVAQEKANSAQLAARYATDHMQTRADQVTVIDAGVGTRQGQQEQLRTQARVELDHEREQGRQRFTALLEEGKAESSALVARSGTEVQGAKEEGERSADRHLQDGQREAEAKQAEAQQRVAAEQRRAQSKSSSWLGQAVSFVRDAVAAVRGAIASIWRSAQAALQTILRRAKDLANRAIDAAITVISGLVRRFVTAIVALVRRIGAAVLAAVQRVLTVLRAVLARVVRALRAAITALVGWLSSALSRLWTALKSLWARLKAGFAVLLARLRALIRRILRPIKVVIGPIQVFPRLGVGGRRLGRLSTGDVPVYVGEIPTQIGVFIVFVTMRTDADLAFTGGGLGPGTIERLELLVDPLGSHYKGSGTVSVAADAAAALTLTGTYSGNASWMGIAGLGVEGGPQIPMSLTAKGADRAHAEVEYHKGTVRFVRSTDLELCLIPAASVNAFLRIKAFAGLPATLPGVGGPGKPGGEGIHCGPHCPTCVVDPGKPGPDRDNSVLPYRERILYQHRWNLANYRTEKCWRWSFDLAAMANSSGAAVARSTRLDTTATPTLFTELHAAAHPGTGAPTPQGEAEAARRGTSSPQPKQSQGTTVEECGDCCVGDTPSGKVKCKGWPRNGGFVIYGDGRRKHTQNIRCQPKGSGACDVNVLVTAASAPIGTYGPCLTRWQQAVSNADTEYGGQLGSEVDKSVYESIIKEAVEGNIKDSKGSYFTDYGSPIGADVENSGKSTSIAMVNDAESKAHIIPVSAMPSTAAAAKVRAQAICKCVGDAACGGGKIHKKYFEVDNCRTAKRDAEKICNNDPEMIEKCTRPKCYYRHGDYRCPA